MRSTSLCVILMAAACGGDPAPANPDAAVSDARIPTLVDAGPDADLRDAEPPPRDDGGMLLFDPGVVLDRIELAPSGHAFAPFAPVVNVEYQQAIANGDLLLLVEWRGLDDPAGQDDPDGLALALYSGLDLDGDPSDNFSGMEMLEVAPDSLDATGNPRALLPDATLAGGQLSGADPGPLALFLSGLGDLQVYDVAFAGTLVSSSDGSYVAVLEGGSITGVILARDLAAIPNAVPDVCLGDSTLDIIAIGCLGVDGVQPDVDRDEDGLESFREKPGFYDWIIDECVDGDGTVYGTVPGIPCALDPAFQDGYTVRIDVSGVRAFLVP